MSKVLDEIRDGKRNEFLEEGNSTSPYKAGFDAAIALELPVLFMEWKDSNCIRSPWDNNTWLLNWQDEIPKTNKELYTYYITHIYKP